MSLFTPLEGIIGGSLIGLSAATLLLVNGDILGASGIISAILVEPRKTFSDPSLIWKSFFIAAFFLSSQIYMGKSARANPLFKDPPLVSPLGYAIGGLLVGFGTKLGNGCTSGHGICGMARLSKRSFVAVASFMSTAFLTSFLMTGPLSSQTTFLRSEHSPVFLEYIGYVITGISVLTAAFHSRATPGTEVTTATLSNYRRKAWAAIAAGGLFSVGLFLSGMIFPVKIFGFLNLAGISDATFDPTLLTVMGAGVVVSFLSYQLVAGHNVVKHKIIMECPVAMSEVCNQTGKFCVPTNTTIDGQLLVGSALFGIGWGVAGLCPGPALFNAGIGSIYTIGLWWPTFWGGSFLAEVLKKNLTKVADAEFSDSDNADIASENVVEPRDMERGDLDGKSSVGQMVLVVNLDVERPIIVTEERKLLHDSEGKVLLYSTQSPPS